MDCEGCEYSLLQLDEEHIKLSKQYIMEIHGCKILYTRYIELLKALQKIRKK